jgi:hypothetical protein
MKLIAPSLYSFLSGAISIVLFLLIPISFLLLALGINSIPVEFAFGQEAGENTRKPNTSVTNFSPILFQKQKQEQHPFPQSEITLQPSLLPSEAFIPHAPDAIPPDTVLPLVTDSNTGSTIQNGGASDSSSALSLTFDGLDETGNAVAGFQCRLDGLPSYYCTPPVTVDNNQIMPVMTTGISSIQPSTNIHTFQVSAVDAAGNIDPSPASFKWNLINSIEKDPLSSDAAPPDTQIVSAVGSNNAAVLNGSSASIPLLSSTSLVVSQHATSGSAANAIAFSFAGTDNSNVVTGYECAAYSSSSLAEQTVFAPCASPVILNISVLEQSTTSTEARNGIDPTYIFQVRATDSAGNVDPSPAIFQWSNTLATGVEEVPTKMGIDQDTLLQ